MLPSIHPLALFWSGMVCDAYRERFQEKKVWGVVTQDPCGYLALSGAAYRWEHHTSWVGRAYRIEAACTREAHVQT